jgi:hypothetical protein
MTYWTVLIITVLSGPMSGAKVTIPYPSAEACRLALPFVSATLSYDHNMECVESTTASKSIRPKNRGHN